MDRKNPRSCAFVRVLCAALRVNVRRQEKIHVGDAFERVLNTLRRVNVRSGVSQIEIRMESALERTRAHV